MHCDKRAASQGRTIQSLQAVAKFEKDIKDETLKPVEVSIPCESDVRIPHLAETPSNLNIESSKPKRTAVQKEEIDTNRDLFVWEQLDPRFDHVTRTWRDE